MRFEWFRRGVFYPFTGDLKKNMENSTTLTVQKKKKKLSGPDQARRISFRKILFINEG